MQHRWADWPHILDTRQFKERAVLDELFQTANEMRRRCEAGKPIDIAHGKILVTLFYEPSTRTRHSFESAIIRLGGQPLSTADAPRFSSAAKGETLEDTVRVESEYGDALVLRHPENGAAERAAPHSRVPLINAGDGSNQHPTQSLLDIYTISRELGRIDGLKVGFLGDNKKSRTVRSLAYLLAHQNGNELVFIAPDVCAPEPDIAAYLSEKGVKQSVTDSLDALPELDVLYVTRLQLERYAGDDKQKLESLKNEYARFAVNAQLVGRMKSGGIIMHPLPRVDEIARSVDDDHRARYFEQAKNGLYMRMALLANVLALPAA